MDRLWQKVYPKISKEFLKPQKTKGTRIHEAFLLIPHFEVVPDELQTALVSILHNKSHLPFIRIKAIEILGERFDPLFKSTASAIQDCLEDGNNPDLRLAAYCCLLKSKIDPNFSENNLVSLVPVISHESVPSLVWLICHSDINLDSFWSNLLKRNDSTRVQLFSVRQLSMILDEDRKAHLLIASLDVYEELSNSSQNQILTVLSSYWDLFNPATIAQRILPVCLKALQSSDNFLQQTAARAFVNFDAPADQVLPFLKETKASHPHPEAFDQYIHYFEKTL